MLYKFGSNLDFKMNGNFVILMNSVHRSCYIAGDLRLASRRARGGLGFALVQGRRRRGFLELLSHAIRTEPPPFVPASSLYFRRRR